MSVEPDTTPVQTSPVTETDPVSAAVAALNQHDAECKLGRWECEVRRVLAAARRRALRGAANARPICPKCGTTGCLEDKALDF